MQLTYESENNVPRESQAKNSTSEGGWTRRAREGHGEERHKGDGSIVLFKEKNIGP